MTPDVEERIAYGEAQLKRLISRLIQMPGKVEIGRTSGTNDRYVCWYPHTARELQTPMLEHKVYIQWILYGEWHSEDNRGKLEMCSNLNFADELK